MAVKIRLSRVGTTNRPYYRVVATDGRNKRDGEILANVGSFDPINGTVVQFHEEIYQSWLAKGAIATDSAKKVYRLYKKNGKSSHASITEVVQQETITEEKIAQQAA